MNDWIKNLFTGPDGDSDEMALIALGMAFIFILISFYQYVWLAKTFDPQAWGTGAGLAIGGIAAGMGYKNSKEMKP